MTELLALFTPLTHSLTYPPTHSLTHLRRQKSVLMPPRQGYVSLVSKPSSTWPRPERPSGPIGQLAFGQLLAWSGVGR